MTKAQRPAQILYAHIDGASRGNPGESGIGIILRDAKGNTVFSGGGYLGKGTNNEAEYNALLACLKKIKSVLMDQTRPQPRRAVGQGLGGREHAESKIEKVIVYSDSELLVNQLRGSYKVKDERLKKLFRRAARLIHSLPIKVEIHLVAREQNQDADMLANYGINTRIKLGV
ncbi:MAG: ribonuclease HI family protein [Bacteroidota bacterium]